jgi:hypothetical protein
MISDTTPTYFNTFISRSSSLSSTLEFKLALFAAMGIYRYSDLLLSALGFKSLRILQGADAAVPTDNLLQSPCFRSFMVSQQFCIEGWVSFLGTGAHFIPRATRRELKLSTGLASCYNFDTQRFRHSSVFLVLETLVFVEQEVGMN